jgi:hypothetical protein
MAISARSNSHDQKEEPVSTEHPLSDQPAVEKLVELQGLNKTFNRGLQQTCKAGCSEENPADGI